MSLIQSQTLGRPAQPLHRYMNAARQHLRELVVQHEVVLLMTNDQWRTGERLSDGSCSSAAAPGCASCHAAWAGSCADDGCETGKGWDLWLGLPPPRKRFAAGAVPGRPMHDRSTGLGGVSFVVRQAAVICLHLVLCCYWFFAWAPVLWGLRECQTRARTRGGL